MNFLLSDGVAMPLPDGTLDAAYCISVLEHVSNPAAFLLEMARALKTGGLLLLTIDLDLRGDHEILPAPYLQLKKAIEDTFDYAYHPVTTHPKALLTSANSPFSPKISGPIGTSTHILKQMVKFVCGRKVVPLLPYALAVEGFVLRKK